MNIALVDDRAAAREELSGYLKESLFRIMEDKE